MRYAQSACIARFYLGTSEVPRQIGVIYEYHPLRRIDQDFLGHEVAQSIVAIGVIWRRNYSPQPHRSHYCSILVLAHIPHSLHFFDVVLGLPLASAARRPTRAASFGFAPCRAIPGCAMGAGFPPFFRAVSASLRVDSASIVRLPSDSALFCLHSVVRGPH